MPQTKVTGVRDKDVTSNHGSITALSRLSNAATLLQTYLHRFLPWVTKDGKDLLKEAEEVSHKAPLL